MNSENLPKGWAAGETMPEDRQYSDPPASPDPSKILIVGLLEGDPSHRYYSVPADTPVAEVVRVFKVGTHGAQSYDFDEDETMQIVAKKSSMLLDLVPGHVVMADAAGLKLRFSRQITEEDAAAMEALFPDEEDPMQAGLEGYLSEWDGEGLLFASVIKDNLFHFWWD